MARRGGARKRTAKARRPDRPSGGTPSGPGPGPGPGPGHGHGHGHSHSPAERNGPPGAPSELAAPGSNELLAGGDRSISPRPHSNEPSAGERPGVVAAPAEEHVDRVRAGG